MSCTSQEKIFSVPCCLVDDRIVPDVSIEDIKNHVSDSSVVVLKNVFPKDELNSIRKRLHQWSRSANAENPTNVTHSFYRIDNNPPQSKTPHIFIGYIFAVDENGAPIFDGDGMDELRHDLQRYFNILADFQRSYVGLEMPFKGGEQDLTLQPQVIHYPSGGGFFDVHVHPLEPQKIGLILGLSEKGVHYQQGGTRFRLDGEMTSVEGALNIGDICIFKYDIEHDVSPVDANEALDLTSERGRWTMVLPFKKR